MQQALQACGYNASLLLVKIDMLHLFQNEVIVLKFIKY